VGEGIETVLSAIHHPHRLSCRLLPPLQQRPLLLSIIVMVKDVLEAEEMTCVSTRLKQ
jgi:hypothetical protein